MPRPRRSSRTAGFTLVELLVVVAIIATLIGLLLPAVQAVRESSSRTSCLNNLRQVGLAMQSYGDAKRRLPPGYSSAFNGSGADTGPGWGWAAHILPQLEQATVFSGIDFTAPIEAARHSRVRTTSIPTLLCPSDGGSTAPITVGPRDATGRLTSATCDVAPATYVASFGVGEPGIDGDGIAFRNSDLSFRDITDGLVKTLLVGERSGRDSDSTWAGAVTGANQVTAPSSRLGLQVNNASNFVLGHTGESYQGPGGPTEINNFTSRHPSGCCFVFVDAHTSFLDSSIDYGTYKALSTRAGGESVTGAF